MEKYEVTYQGVELEIERLPNGKFKKPSLSRFTKQGLACTWLDDGRIPYKNEEDFRTNFRQDKRPKTEFDSFLGKLGVHNPDPHCGMSLEKGRFPANLLVSDNAVDDGIVTRTDNPTRTPKTTGDRSQSHVGDFGIKQGGGGGKVYADAGGFSRYFSLDAWATENLPESVQRTFPFLACPKAGKKEKEMGLEGEGQIPQRYGEMKGTPEHAPNRQSKQRNAHPTVKPLKLMSYLVTLGSRPGDLVLDPFAGTCTTGMAAKMLGRNYLMIEIDEQWCRIGRRRVEAVQERML